MAKLKAPIRHAVEHRHPYAEWVADTVEKIIPTGELHQHPENFTLVGRIDKTTRAALKEDIEKNGIREPLQVWWDGEKLILVSGHERLSVAKELGLQSVPCIKKDFSDPAAVRRHIYSTNKHRKNVQTPAPEVLELLFPPGDYPLLYADLRANFDYGESEQTGSLITPEQARARRETQRAEQHRLRKKVAEQTGLAPSTVDRASRDARRKQAGKSSRKATTTPRAGLVADLTRVLKKHKATKAEMRAAFEKALRSL